MDETIFAVASAPGRAGVAVLRVSGPSAGTVVARFCRPHELEPRHATLVRLISEWDEPLDDALALWFPAPRSYTGEDVLELHVHGGRAVLAGVTDALAAIPGLRPAEPGEFTRRSFDNGKLDLTAAEGLADLIDAETAGQRRQALRQLGGGLAALYEGWRAKLLRALAYLEAEIDFSDEDLPAETVGQSRGAIEALAGEIAVYLDDRRRGEILREGFSIAIVGPPNAGKSSLLNALARREVAIVHESAGTTRDVVEVRLDIGGYAVLVADTAGLRDAPEAVEAEGIRRARARAEAADLRVLVLDATRPVLDASLAGLLGPDTLVVVNKCDLAAAPPDIAGLQTMRLSCRTGAGFTALLAELERRVRDRVSAGGETHPVLTRARHRRALEDCLAALRRCVGASQPDLAAEDARLAARALGRITGRVDVEDLLDVIFRDFCIGK